MQHRTRSVARADGGEPSICAAQELECTINTATVLHHQCHTAHLDCLYTCEAVGVLQRIQWSLSLTLPSLHQQSQQTDLDHPHWADTNEGSIDQQCKQAYQLHCSSLTLGRQLSINHRLIKRNLYLLHCQHMHYALLPS